MALIKCSECGREISDKAGSCPGCGNPIQIQRNTEMPGLLKEKSENTENPGDGSIKVGAVNKLPKRVSLDVLVVLFLVALIIYWVISMVNKDFATGFFWFVMIYIGIPWFAIDYIKTQRISYVVDKEKITINKGIIIKNSNTINYNLITNVYIRRNVFARIMGLSNVFLSTANAFAGGVLILNKDDAEWLKNFILSNKQ